MLVFPEDVAVRLVNEVQNSLQEIVILREKKRAPWFTFYIVLAHFFKAKLHWDDSKGRQL